jgi:hypothetical protein
MSAVALVDDAFWPLLVADAHRWGADPRVVAQVMMSESGLDPSAWNRAGDAIGLNQLAPVNHHLFAPLTREEYHALSASEQWKAGASKFFDAELTAHPEAGHDVAALYWLNYKPGTYVKGASEDFDIGPDAGNPLLMIDGTVTPASLRAFATRDQRSPRWKSVLAAIAAAESSAPTMPSFPVAPTAPHGSTLVEPAGVTSDAVPFVLAAGLGFLAWRALRRRGRMGS